MDIKQANVLVLTTDGVEQSEIKTPRDTLTAAGAKVDVVAPKDRQGRATIRAWKNKDWGEDIPVDKDLEDVNAQDYDALVIPGGVINPDHLRTNAHAVHLVRTFFNTGKPVAAICHGPWLLVEADVLRSSRHLVYVHQDGRDQCRRQLAGRRRRRRRRAHHQPQSRRPRAVLPEDHRGDRRGAAPAFRRLIRVTLGRATRAERVRRASGPVRGSHVSRQTGPCVPSPMGPRRSAGRRAAPCPSPPYSFRR